MKVALLGYDTEGKVSYDYYKGLGADITICDQKTDIVVPEGVASQLGEGYLDNLDRFDVLVRTAGMPPSVILAKNPAVASKITTQVNEFMRVCPTRNIIGVTGTKGKGTTSTLLAHMLEASGRQVFLGGNIGVPPMSFLDNITEDSWVVLELSSFQLSDIQRSPHIGVCLMVVPEHLNWHETMDEYTGAKAHLFEYQSSDDIAIYYADNALSQEIAAAGAGRKLPFYRSPGAWVNGNMITIDGAEICTTDDLQLLGAHNWQNVCAALTAYWQVDQNIDAARSVLTSFSGLPHRLEFLRELDGVRFYNDSFAAGLHATEAAIEAIPGPKVVIVGGFDRMLPLEHFAPFAIGHANQLRQLLLIGQSADRLADVLSRNGYHNFIVDHEATDMPAIVAHARSLAQPGDAVILSPGFASFDMFKNFEDRGEKYRQAVQAL